MDEQKEKWLEFVLIEYDMTDHLETIVKMIEDGKLALGPKTEKMIADDSPGDGYLEIEVNGQEDIYLVADELDRHGITD